MIMEDNDFEADDDNNSVDSLLLDLNHPTTQSTLLGDTSSSNGEDEAKESHNSPLSDQEGSNTLQENISDSSSNTNDTQRRYITSHGGILRNNNRMISSSENGKERDTTSISDDSSSNDPQSTIGSDSYSDNAIMTQLQRKSLPLTHSLSHNNLTLYQDQGVLSHPFVAESTPYHIRTGNRNVLNRNGSVSESSSSWTSRSQRGRKMNEKKNYNDLNKQGREALSVVARGHPLKPEELVALERIIDDNQKLMQFGPYYNLL
jgi:hypothetical protein